MPRVFCAGDASSSHCSGVLAMSLFSSKRPSEYYARIKSMRARLPSRAFRFAAALGIVLAITFVYQKALGVNATTVALTFLLAILVVSTVWGLAVSVFMSIAATLAYNYYFLPPIGELTIADPQNWVALFAFLVTAVMASHLSARAKQQADDAHRRRREIEKLYAFSQQLLSAGNVIELLNAIPGHVAESFEAGAAALFLASKEKIYRSGQDIPQLDADRLKTVIAREEPVVFHARAPGCARHRQPGNFRAGPFPPDAGSTRNIDRHRNRKGTSGRAAQQDRGLQRRRTLEVRSAGFDYPRFQNSTDLDQGLGDEPADEPHPEREAAAGASDCHQRGKRPAQSLGGRSG